MVGATPLTPGMLELEEESTVGVMKEAEEPEMGRFLPERSRMAMRGAEPGVQVSAALETTKQDLIEQMTEMRGPVGGQERLIEVMAKRYPQLPLGV